MKLYKALDLDIEKLNIVSIVGGGGKTTTIKTLATEFRALGKRVLVATTTGIFYPEKCLYDNLFIKELPLDFQPSKGSITYFGEFYDGLKLKTKDLDLVDSIIEREIFDIVLMEADGSKTRPIKAPSQHEPVISKYANITIGLVGMDSIGVSIDQEHVHRPEILKKIVGKDWVDSQAVVRLVKNPEGLFKSSKGRRILILNKADTLDRISEALEIKEGLSSQNISVIIADIQSGKYI